MKLVVIIPALNEEATIAEVIQRIPSAFEAGLDEVEVIVVDDGSSDRTGQAAEQVGASVVRHHRNRGVGAAFQTGISAALDSRADLIVNMDADGQFRPEDIPTLIKPLLENQADMVTCTRFALPDYQPEMPRIKRWGNKMMCRLVNNICQGTSFTDVSCGFRAYTRKTAVRLTLFGQFTYTQESFIDLVGKGVQIVEVPLRVRGQREVGKSRVASNLWNYAKRTSLIILCAARDTRPLAFFGTAGLLVTLFGVLCGMIVFGIWLATGKTSYVRSLLIGSGAFLVLGFLLYVFAMIADMLGRQRQLVEEVLVTLRTQDRQLDEKTRERIGRQLSGSAAEEEFEHAEDG